MLLVVYFVSLWCPSRHPSPKAVVFRFQLWHLGERFDNVSLHLVEFCVIMVKRKGAGKIQVLMYKTQDTQNGDKLGTSTVLSVFQVSHAHLSFACSLACC